ncbi:flagellar basal-body rod protein FlgF [Glycocaulis alkaliphilus]|uniref:Flagellar basal-body rod protein FlgF n=2 Tax=Glycocaulis alkaliphilus TaxID=1434191 RepID=A0A3T0EBU9_9PROT|nr:flagellar basal-body rod protein FlgF [Glycocaulis alkaliphilus]
MAGRRGWQKSGRTRHTARKGEEGAMDNMMMIGLSQQQVLRRAMDITANNIANVSTAGFKAEQLLVEAEPYTRARAEDGPARLNYVAEWGMGRDFSQGTLEQTGRPLDVAITGEGFFTIDTPQGERFTRDGRFSMDAAGTLTSANGAPVLGEDGAPITIDPDAGPVTILANGEVNQNGLVAGRIAVTRFENQGVLSKIGDNLYTAPDDAERELALEPVIRQGFVESSNVRPIMEITSMMEVSRAYSSVTRMLQQADELSRKAIERLGRPG